MNTITRALCILAVGSALSLTPGTLGSASADETTVPTAEECTAKARIYRDHAKSYRAEADENRKTAKGYRELKNAKGRRLNSPEHLQLAAELEHMAKDDEALAKDADKVAGYFERQAEKLRKEAAQ